MGAATKAAALMAKHGLTDADIEMAHEDIRTRHGGGQAVRTRLWGAIGVCTNTAVQLREVDREPVVTYVGREPGPQIAVYLHQVTERSIDREISQFRATTWYKRRRTLKAKRQATADFTLTMVRRLQSRLLDLFEATISEEALLEAGAERDRRLGAGDPIKRKPVVGRYYHAALAGRDAGNGVALSHGVASTEAPLQIGGGK